MMRRLSFFILLVLILTACGSLARPVTPVIPATPIPLQNELLIAPAAVPTATSWLSPMSATTKAHVEAYYPKAAYGVPIIMEPSITPTSLGGFDPVIIGDFRLDFLGRSIETAAYTGTKYVEIKYRFTNNSPETASFAWSISTNAFQDGIELQDYIILDSESTTDIRPGKSITVKDGFQIRSNTSAIELEFSPLLQLWGKTVSRTISLY